MDGDRKTEQEVVRHDEGVNYREAPKDLRTHSAICGNSCPNYTENGFHRTKSGVESKTEKDGKYQSRCNSDTSDQALLRSENSALPTPFWTGSCILQYNIWTPLLVFYRKVLYAGVLNAC